jgi:hypothetical protein
MPHRQHPETRDYRSNISSSLGGQDLYSTCTQRRGPGLASPPLSGHKYASLYEVQMEHWRAAKRAALRQVALNPLAVQGLAAFGQARIFTCQSKRHLECSGQGVNLTSRNNAVV